MLDLQSGKIDLAFALNPTPQRALVIGFSRPVFMHGFGTVAKKGFEPKTWGDLNKPEIKIAVDIGSVHELAARNFAPKAQIIGLKTRDECVLAVQTGRADCVILAVILGLTAVKKNPALGKYVVLKDPLVQLPELHGRALRGRQALARLPRQLGRLQSRRRPDPQMDGRWPRAQRGDAGGHPRRGRASDRAP